MTTSPVMSISEELVADLEFDLEVAETTHQLEASVSREALAALLAERAELLRDRDRLNKLDQAGYAYGFEDIHEGNCWDISGPFKNVRDAIDSMPAIDAAMQSEAKP